MSRVILPKLSQKSKPINSRTRILTCRAFPSPLRHSRFTRTLSLPAYSLPKTCRQLKMRSSNQILQRRKKRNRSLRFPLKHKLRVVLRIRLSNALYFSSRLQSKLSRSKLRQLQFMSQSSNWLRRNLLNHLSTLRRRSKLFPQLYLSSLT